MNTDGVRGAADDNDDDDDGIDDDSDKEDASGVDAADLRAVVGRLPRMVGVTDRGGEDERDAEVDRPSCPAGDCDAATGPALCVDGLAAGFNAAWWYCGSPRDGL